MAVFDLMKAIRRGFLSCDKGMVAVKKQNPRSVVDRGFKIGPEFLISISKL
jgi:hypothetical protein